jgi:hypothetical protein
MDELCTYERCPVPANIFRAWWNRLAALVDESPNDTRLNSLQATLTTIGKIAYAVTEEDSSASIALNEAFDWKNKEIEFALSLNLSPWAQYNPHTFIHELIQTTKIPWRE